MRQNRLRKSYKRFYILSSQGLFGTGSALQLFINVSEKIGKVKGGVAQWLAMRFINVLNRPRHIKREEILSRREDMETLCRENQLGLMYLFGSLAKDRLRPLSDVDVAVLRRDEKPMEIGEYIKIIGELQDIIRREDIDLTDLSDAPPLLCMGVLRGGQLLYCDGKERLSRFRFRTIARFLSTSYLRKNFSHQLQKALLG